MYGSSRPRLKRCSTEVAPGRSPLPGAADSWMLAAGDREMERWIEHGVRWNREMKREEEVRNEE